LKPIAKITVRCPHCGSEQQEPELAKSTFCRRCSEHFAISPATLAGADPPAPVPGPAIRPAKPTSFGSPAPHIEPPALAPAPEASHGFGFLNKLDQLFGKPRTRMARCFECDVSHEVSGSAHSSTCRDCGAYIDLQNYKISTGYSRNIVTRGSVYLTAKGDLSSSRIVCDSAILYGKMRGNLVCSGKVTIKLQGRVPGTIEAAQLVIDKGADISVARPVKVSQLAEIAGKMVGQIISEGPVVIYKSGYLAGGVTAISFNVERGGCFQGDLAIIPRQALVAPAEEAAAQEEAVMEEEVMEEEVRRPLQPPPSSSSADSLLGGGPKPATSLVGNQRFV
jgi:cytoskeletal protein CcmA (bactofilin family)